MTTILWVDHSVKLNKGVRGGVLDPVEDEDYIQKRNRQRREEREAE